MGREMGILIASETGEMFSVSKDSHTNHWILCGYDGHCCGVPPERANVPADDPIRMALEVGRKVTQLAHGRNMSEPIWQMETEASHASVCIICQRKPLKGLEWLMAQPVGTRIQANTHPESDRYVVARDGLYQLGPAVSGLVTWEELKSWGPTGWASDACAENCPKWEPKEK